MDKLICYENTPEMIAAGHGLMTVVHPVPQLFVGGTRERAAFLQAHPHLAEASEEEIFNFIASKDVPEGRQTVIISKSQLPADRYFRNAWSHDGKTFKVDIEESKKVHLNKLRAIRAQKFIDLGFPNRINAQVEEAVLDAPTKQMLKDLRDFPETLDLTDVDDLDVIRNSIPDCLK